MTSQKQTMIRRIIEQEMTFGPAKDFAERLESALLDRINSYCDSFRHTYHLLEENGTCKAITMLQSGIIGGPLYSSEKENEK